MSAPTGAPAGRPQIGPADRRVLLVQRNEGAFAPRLEWSHVHAAFRRLSGKHSTHRELPCPPSLPIRLLWNGCKCDQSCTQPLSSNPTRGTRRPTRFNRNFGNSCYLGRAKTVSETVSIRLYRVRVSTGIDGLIEEDNSGICLCKYLIIEPTSERVLPLEPLRRVPASQFR